MPSFIDLIFWFLFSWLSPFFIYKIITAPRYRAGFLERFGRLSPTPGKKRSIWIHGVSVGEVLGAVSLIERIEKAFPQFDVVISATTMEGYDVARQRFPKLRVVYYPLDFSFACHAFFRSLRPALVVLMELELWPNFVITAERRRVPIAIVNGRISARSFRRYHFFRQIFSKYLGKIQLICAQDSSYAQRFRALGVSEGRLRVTGTMKYDNVDLSSDVPAMNAEIRAELGFTAAERIVLGGSTHEPEEAILAKAADGLRGEFPDLRLILVPRHIQRAKAVAQTCLALGLEPILMTEFRQKRAQGAAPSLDGGKILVVDTIGDLKRLYAAANLVFVGGSLIRHGGQNMIEPAGLGKPVVVGPHTFNFANDVARLVEVDALAVVEGAELVPERIRDLLRQPEKAAAMGLRGRRMIEAHVGATERNLGAIRELLESALEREIPLR